ncbi:TMEM175 family protein [Synechococcus sp. UW179A]|uniref:TMEM175 family protein n=1 Tax=Synechococcus sp. UW179A TaxID=2575510 RepID=UPI000E0E2F27|nr:TMEM175 family protein [Synechococcus sp. UW179A]
MDGIENSISPAQRRSFERLINFTDAVVAIAITLQLLPLVDIKAANGESMWKLISDNSSQILAFWFSFLILSVLWIKHNQVFNSMRAFDGTIFWLNSFWMALIVFLPWPTALYGSLNDGQLTEPNGIGLFYWWTLALISGIGGLVAIHAWNKPELLEPSVLLERSENSGLKKYRGASFVTAFLLFGLVAEFSPQLVPYLSIGIIPMDLLLRKSSGRKSRKNHLSNSL